MVLESPQFFPKSSLSSTIVHLALRGKEAMCWPYCGAVPKGHNLIRLLYLRG